MKRSTISIFLSIVVLTFLFQNCSQEGSLHVESKGSSTGELVESNQDIPPNQNNDLVEPIISENSEVNSGSENPIGVIETIPNENNNIVVCDPLIQSGICDLSSKKGLIGNLYYLTDSHKYLFGDSLYNATLDDYKKWGNQVNVSIIMSSFDVSPRSWIDGFYINDQALVQTEDGNTLFEWFSIDLSGEFQLPEGDYQLATVSDDGIKVTLNELVIINNPSIHAPTWDCSTRIVHFNKDEKKSIKVGYFQGPRTQIALQLFMRPVTSGETSCKKDLFKIIPQEAFSHL